MKFCPSCGSNVNLKIPENDNRERYVCVSCEVIHYQNPKIVTGCIPQSQDKILICKRAIEPRKGLWTLPAGFMENGETNQQGAARESEEEANAIMENMQLFSVFSIPHISQVYTFYRADVKDGFASPGYESLETKFVTEQEMPWSEMAFPVVVETLKLFFQDRKNGNFTTHYGDIIKQNDMSLKIVHY